MARHRSYQSGVGLTTTIRTEARDEEEAILLTRLGAAQARERTREDRKRKNRRVVKMPVFGAGKEDE